MILMDGVSIFEQEGRFFQKCGLLLICRLKKCVAIVDIQIHISWPQSMANKLWISLLLFNFCFGFIYGACYKPVTQDPFQIPKPAERDLPYCSWYNEDTCCTNTGPLVTDFGGGPFKQPSSGCQDQLVLYLCRFCSPMYSDYLSSDTAKFRVCSNFADEFYESCKGSEIQVQGEKGPECKKIGSGWKNGKDFIQNVFDQLYEEDRLQNPCFNSANPFAFTCWLLCSAIIFLLYFL